MTGEELSLRREESLKLLEGFRLIDDDFMTAFFEDDIPCTELVLRIVLDMPDLTVEEVHTQVHSSNLPEDRALRMDVVARDGQGRLMHDFFCTRGEDMHYGVLAKRMDYFKKTNEGSDTMCRAVEDWLNKNKLQSARDMLTDGVLPEKIAQYLRLSLDEVKQLEKEMASCAERWKS